LTTKLGSEYIPTPGDGYLSLWLSLAVTVVGG